MSNRFTRTIHRLRKRNQRLGYKPSRPVISFLLAVTLYGALCVLFFLNWNDEDIF